MADRRFTKRKQVVYRSGVASTTMHNCASPVFDNNYILLDKVLYLVKKYGFTSEELADVCKAKYSWFIRSMCMDTALHSGVLRRWLRNADAFERENRVQEVCVTKRKNPVDRGGALRELFKELDLPMSLFESYCGCKKNALVSVLRSGRPLSEKSYIRYMDCIYKSRCACSLAIAQKTNTDYGTCLRRVESLVEKYR